MAFSRSKSYIRNDAMGKELDVELKDGVYQLQLNVQEYAGGGGARALAALEPTRPNSRQVEPQGRPTRSPQGERQAASSNDDHVGLAPMEEMEEGENGGAAQAATRHRCVGLDSPQMRRTRRLR